MADVVNVDTSSQVNVYNSARENLYDFRDFDIFAARWNAGLGGGNIGSATWA
jgi:hypothetical protein